ncbi:hypothetical protein APHAL10511_000427 [Amanita phalloides]|nr:hypothetical protein APHAL10511_000427 [Amanita phalloides]
MPPRKAVDPAEAPAPRRSTRISAHAKDVEGPKQTTTKNNTKKRTAGGDGDSSHKKARSDPQAMDTDGNDYDNKPEGGQLASLEVGGLLPTLTLKNEKEEDVQVAELAADQGVVLFLVPKADTPGCTIQACGFRDIYQEFAALGYDVYCLSADTPSAQTKWQTKKVLPYHLLSDSNRILISALGAGGGGKTKRSHFIFEKGGKLVDKKIPVKPNDSPKLALEFIKNHSSESNNP